jgi:hypothetical protein
MKKLERFIDDYTFLVQKTPDHFNAVDSNFLTTNALYQKLASEDNEWVNGNKCTTTAILALYRFFTNGKIRRYHSIQDSEEGRLWTDPRTVSRDNSIGYIILAGFMGETNRVKKIALDILKRGSFFQNTHTTKGKRKFLPDFCGLSTWSIIYRALFQKKSLVLFLYLLDFFWLLHLIVHVLKSHTKYFQTSTVFHQVSALIQTKLTKETLFSKLGFSFYFLFHRSFKDYFEEGDNGVISALRYYSRAKYDPPIYDITKKSLDKFLKI